ncbi:MAG: hypothetical protein GVY15_07485 [Bacteroidetes bacterium]|jgi:predicted nucleotidyltransferase|nr:hypothetical protein [Bacteroidota bacterium]
MPFNIAQQEKEEAIASIARRVAEATGAQEVWGFGSRIWGGDTNDSDLDLLVVVEMVAPDPATIATRGYDALPDVDIPIDIVVKSEEAFHIHADVTGSLAHTVRTSGRKLYG